MRYRASRCTAVVPATMEMSSLSLTYLPGRRDEVQGILQEAAALDRPVLVIGERGTGKELMARAKATEMLRAQVQRASKPRAETYFLLGRVLEIGRAHV